MPQEESTCCTIKVKVHRRQYRHVALSSKWVGAQSVQKCLGYSSAGVILFPLLFLPPPCRLQRVVQTFFFLETNTKHPISNRYSMQLFTMDIDEFPKLSY